MHRDQTTVILLEDDAGLRGLMAEGLGEQHYHVVEAPDVAAASRAIHAVDGHAVLVADRALGATANAQNANGFVAAAQALAEYPALRAVYTSGTHQVLRHRQLSARERSLPKPFALSQLVSTVRTLA